MPARDSSNSRSGSPRGSSDRRAAAPRSKGAAVGKRSDGTSDRGRGRGRPDGAPARGRRSDEPRSSPNRIDRPTRGRPAPGAPRIEPAPAPRGTSGRRERPGTAPEAWEPEQWVDDGPLRDEASQAVARGAKRAGSPKRRSARELALHDELNRSLGTAAAGRIQERVVTAASSFDRERYAEVRKLLAPVVQQHPELAVAHELLGLSYYRLGQWRQAAAELEAHRNLTGTAQHLAVLADCYRALRRYTEVAERWRELREASPAAALVAEGRIVYAGSLADRGDLRGALKELKGAEKVPRRVREHHVRMWYVVADLYDRSGDTTRARAYFQRVNEHAPGYADVEARLAGLGR